MFVDELRKVQYGAIACERTEAAETSTIPVRTWSQRGKEINIAETLKDEVVYCPA